MFTGYKDLSPAALRELLRDNRDLNSVDFSGMEFKDSDLSGKRFTACRFSRSVFSESILMVAGSACVSLNLPASQSVP